MPASPPTSFFLFSLLSLCLGQLAGSIQAQWAGAEISYYYTGDTSGVPYQYQVSLDLYAVGDTGKGMDTAAVEILSSCSGAQSLQLQRYFRPQDSLRPDSGIYLPRYDPCAYRGDTNYTALTLQRFRGLVQLPGPCADYRFYWRACCRMPALVNIKKPDSSHFYIEARLNNTHRDHHSPQYLLSGAATACHFEDQYLSEEARQPNRHDSLIYALTPVMDSVQSTVIYQPGFSGTQPLTSMNGVQMNARTGSISFKPIQTGWYAMKTSINAYWPGTAVPMWQFEGSAGREWPLLITDSCVAISTPPVVPADTMGLFQGLPVASCPGDTLHIRVPDGLHCRHIHPGGDNFRLINTRDNLAVPILAAVVDSCHEGLAFRIGLVLYHSLQSHSVYRLQTKKAGPPYDLISACGRYWPEYDTASLFYTDSCGDMSLTETDPGRYLPYPNPTEGLLHIPLAPGEYQMQYRLTDATGRILRQGQVSGDHRPAVLNLTALPRGLYFFYLQGRGRATTILKK